MYLFIAFSSALACFFISFLSNSPSPFLSAAWKYNYLWNSYSIFFMSKVVFNQILDLFFHHFISALPCISSLLKKQADFKNVLKKPVSVFDNIFAVQRQTEWKGYAIERHVGAGKLLPRILLLRMLSSAHRRRRRSQRRQTVLSIQTYSFCYLSNCSLCASTESYSYVKCTGCRSLLVDYVCSHKTVQLAHLISHLSLLQKADTE